MFDAFGMHMVDSGKVEKHKICKKRPLATETLPVPAGDNADVIHEDPPAEKEHRRPDSTLPSKTDEPAEEVQQTSSDDLVKDTTAFLTETPPTVMTATLQERAHAPFATSKERLDVWCGDTTTYPR